MTQDSEKIMAYCARVSSPNNQDNPDYAKLLKYCINNKHWSIFETASMTLEITTSRAIAAQILRHKSFNFQEFSQRYSQPQSYEKYSARRQDNKNRQNSIDDLPESDVEWFSASQEEVWRLSKAKYDEAIQKGIAKECARFLLPMNTTTRLYMTGNVRSWITYIELRSANGTQKEHCDIALAAKAIFIEKFPTVAEALNWK